MLAAQRDAEPLRITFDNDVASKVQVEAGSPACTRSSGWL